MTDALILHGLVRYLMWAGVREGSVKRTGDRFVISIEDNGVDEERALKQLSYIESACEKAREGFTSRFIDKINAAISINPSVRERWIKSMVKSVKTTREQGVLNAYKDPDHKHKMTEGRFERAEHTIYLPLGPVYGKYKRGDYSIKKGVQYIVCGKCFLMTNLGLVYGSHISRIRKGDTYSLIVTTFIPSSEANLIDMV